MSKPLVGWWWTIWHRLQPEKARAFLLKRILADPETKIEIDRIATEYLDDYATKEPQPNYIADVPGVQRK